MKAVWALVKIKSAIIKASAAFTFVPHLVIEDFNEYHFRIFTSYV
jgi:hypothetical protein